MRIHNRRLYESIIRDVAKSVKKHLNESNNMFNGYSVVFFNDKELLLNDCLEFTNYEDALIEGLSSTGFELLDFIKNKEYILYDFDLNKDVISYYRNNGYTLQTINNIKIWVNNSCDFYNASKNNYMILPGKLNTLCKFLKTNIINGIENIIQQNNTYWDYDDLIMDKNGNTELLSVLNDNMYKISGIFFEDFFNSLPDFVQEEIRYYINDIIYNFFDGDRNVSSKNFYDYD